MKNKVIRLIKSVAGLIEYRFSPWRYPQDELIVLCLHSTPKKYLSQLNDITDFLLKHFIPLDPAQLEDYFSGRLAQGPYVLFTFDDGLRNNKFAADLLHVRGIHAFFFVVPDFLTSTDAELYYRTNIRQVIEPGFDRHEEDVTPLSVYELLELIKQGHVVGSHTMSHLMRSTCSAEQGEQEVVGSKRKLEGLLGVAIEGFCSPINTNFSVNSRSKALINEHYAYHFTTFPGEHTVEKNPKLIFRRNIEVNWTLGQIKFALGRADLKRWSHETERFRQL